MSLVEIDRVLRKLRLSGMADVLDIRVQGAAAERQPLLDFLSALVGDELPAPAGPVARAPHQAGRVPRRRQDPRQLRPRVQRSRNPRVSSSAARTCSSSDRRAPASATSLGFSAIQQGHRVLYREALVLLDELADATLERRRKEAMTDFAEAADHGRRGTARALLDRLLHHAHVIQCGPRSWRTHHAANLPKAFSGIEAAEARLVGP